MRTNAFKLILCLGAVLVWLAGCVQAPLKTKPIAKTENPAALVKNLGNGIAEAKAARVDLLSPTWFANAKASHAKAKAGLEKGTALNAILENIATGSAELQQAEKYAQKSSQSLSDLIESRDAAHKAGAASYAKPFAKLESDFLKLTRAVESRNTKYVKTRKKGVNDRYRALELTAIKDTALTEVRGMIQKGEDLDMHKEVPKSFLIAKSKLADADAAITRDRYDTNTIDAKVATAKFFAQRMHQLGRTAVRLEEMAPEQIALWMEAYLSQINSYLKGDDHRNLTFDQQQAAIADLISLANNNRSSVSSLVEAKNREIKTLNARIADLEGRTYQARADKERLAAEKARLAAEKRFNELYNKVQGYFSADQAEVYKKAQHLVIRLKAMRFPVGQAVIVPESYSLLTTVQKAIATFGQPVVVIEGHSDSTGSADINRVLSQKRAESVRSYLIANKTLPAAKINARGYGSSRPLASNATAAGRAINRRIDVVIKPSMK